MAADGTGGAAAVEEEVGGGSADAVGGDFGDSGLKMSVVRRSACVRGEESGKETHVVKVVPLPVLVVLRKRRVMTSSKSSEVVRNGVKFVVERVGRFRDNGYSIGAKFLLVDEAAFDPVAFDEGLHVEVEGEVD
jgi:hypothetical protein